MKNENLTILIVDDIKVNYVILKAMLKPLTRNIIWARDPREALEYCEKFHLDLVLMDFQLPEMNGLELSKKIKLKNKDLPIIFQTANAHIVNAFDSEEYNFETVLEKPLEKELLYSTINEFVTI